MKIDTLLAEAGLTVEQINDRGARLGVRQQIRFLGLAANVLQDELLGFHLAQACDLRELGLLYYVPASSQTLGEALRRAARCASMVNESLSIQFVEGKDIKIILNYVGVARHSDRHQVEFCLTILARLCRSLTGLHLVPSRVKLAQRADRALRKLSAFLGREIEFDARADEVTFASVVRDIPVVSADPYLNKLLVAGCEQALLRQPSTRGTFETKVVNAIAPLLPHGTTDASEIARQLGMSQRTFARRLAFEGLTFRKLLGTLREQLALEYLADRTLPISEIAWLLGYRQVSAFTHAFKRWTSKSPREVRLQRG
jgi:AraC-like DNA-binding protein